MIRRRQGRNQMGEMLAKGHGRSSMMIMPACVVTTQLVATSME